MTRLEKIKWIISKYGCYPYINQDSCDSFKTFLNEQVESVVAFDLSYTSDGEYELSLDVFYTKSEYLIQCIKLYYDMEMI